MFRMMGFVFLILALSACSQNSSVSIQQQEILQKEAASIVHKFAKTLKPQLKQALKHGGPAYAIKVCSEVAPALVRQLSEETGWKIKRVSLKARNHHTALPDVWETSVLQQFDHNQIQGKNLTEMVATRIEHGQFRFMKAQEVAPVCLLCHGKQIAPDVVKALKEYYPQDQATGYELGQVRGAFSLSKKL